MKTYLDSEEEAHALIEEARNVHKMSYLPVLEETSSREFIYLQFQCSTDKQTSENLTFLYQARPEEISLANFITIK